MKVPATGNEKQNQKSIWDGFGSIGLKKLNSDVKTPVVPENEERSIVIQINESLDNQSQFNNKSTGFFQKENLT